MRGRPPRRELVSLPTARAGNLLTSSNYNDNQKKVTGGRNGYGASWPHDRCTAQLTAARRPRASSHPETALLQTSPPARLPEARPTQPRARRREAGQHLLEGVHGGDDRLG